MRFIEAENAWHEPTIWVGDEPVLSRCNLEPKMRDAWPHIVLCLTAGPTIESARVVIEALKDEIKALTDANSELTCANTDLNRELTSLRQAMVDGRDREGCE